MLASIKRYSPPLYPLRISHLRLNLYVPQSRRVNKSHQHHPYPSDPLLEPLQSRPMSLTLTRSRTRIPVVCIEVFQEHLIALTLSVLVLVLAVKNSGDQGRGRSILSEWLTRRNDHSSAHQVARICSKVVKSGSCDVRPRERVKRAWVLGVVHATRVKVRDRAWVCWVERPVIRRDDESQARVSPYSRTYRHC